jgi:glycosyltransferase involved in cell wall biosynthesis
MSMKVLFQSRTTLFSVPGGDTTQVLKTAEGLRRLGCTVEISTDLHPDLRGFDLVHLFNLMRPQESLPQVLNARRQGRKVALSTIYGPYVDFDRSQRRGLVGAMARTLPHSWFEYAKTAGRAVVNREMNTGVLRLLLTGFRRAQRTIVDMTDVFLPNSESEMARVWADFPESLDKLWRAVPNAVDTDLFGPGKGEANAAPPWAKGAILSVARIEGRKCQLELVRAAKRLGHPLAIIGKPGPNSHDYFKQIQAEAKGHPLIHLEGYVAHEDLAPIYRAARVHALVSWMETPGLSSLEAAAMGCNVVLTKKGDAWSYFGDQGFYCEPDSVNSIASALDQAYQTPVDPALADRVVREYTWDEAAKMTLQGYRDALNA